MVSSKKQQTIKKVVSFSGPALHSGRETKIKFLPAPGETGVIFRRVDLSSAPEIAASPQRVVSTERCTTLGRKFSGQEIEVSTVEHLLAAVWSLGLDNLLVEVDGPEIPITDGSAYPFFKLLKKAGAVAQKQKRHIIKPEEPLRVKDGPDKYLAYFPHEGFKISFILQYDNPVVGTQFFQFENRENNFEEKLVRARTFGFEKEIDYLHENGLAQGGSLDNALVFGEKQPVNEPRFADEPVRHKVLDLIGDLSLNGFVEGHFIAIKSGHTLNVKLANKIFAAL
ncbi:MAG: UDP-3-O-acyl-N-acetylglucosamine deacetylase [Bacillota bacterium]